MTSTTDELLSNNARYAEGFAVPADADLRVAIVACMDARLDVYSVLGLRLGEAHVLRNAGGIVTDDVIRSLAISQRLLGTREIVLIHHTRCGMLTFTDEEFAGSIRDDTGVAPPWNAGAFADLEGDVLICLASLRSSPFLMHRDGIRGFIYDVTSGRLREVV